MLDVTRLRVLAAVARHGSVTAAAKSLNYAQPSVSHHLARLEAETGTRLVERSGRGVKLTDAGRLLAGRAEEILGRLDAAEQELAAHVGQRLARLDRHEISAQNEHAPQQADRFIGRWARLVGSNQCFQRGLQHQVFQPWCGILIA